MPKGTDIERWMKRARRLMTECPAGYWLFAANGNLYVLRKTKDGKRAVLPDEGMDAGQVVGAIAGHGMPGPEIDGGDW